jgi:MscS family membrane protein
VWLLLLAIPSAPGAFAEDAGETTPGRTSARATMQSFLEAMNDAAIGQTERIQDAVACLDLGAIDPSLRETKGREAAIELKEIIDRTRLVKYEEIPDDPSAPPYVFLREQHGDVVIARSADADGEWLFTEATVTQIPALLRSALSRERIQGVRAAPTALSPATWLRAHIPAGLRRASFLLEHWQWLGLLALILIGVIVDRVLSMLAVSGSRRAFLRLLPEVKLELVRAAVRPIGILAMALVWWFGVLWLGLPSQVLSVLLLAVKFLAATSGVWAAYRFVDVLSEYLSQRAARTKSRFDDLLVPLVRKSLKTFIIAFGLVFIADNLNVNITSLIAGLGLGGLAFALAAQDTVKNLFGSLTVILDRPFRVGDWVVVDDHEGTVEEVGFRSTRIRTFYNSIITLPNANLIASAVDNLGARFYRRWKAYLSVTYDTPPEKIEAFCEGIRELVRRHPHTRKDYFHVYVNQFSAASLDILLYVFFHTPDWGRELEERHKLFLDILRLAKELEVEFAFPTQTLHVYRPGEGPDHGPPVDVSEAVDRGRHAARAVFPGGPPG